MQRSLPAVALVYSVLALCSPTRLRPWSTSTAASAFAPSSHPHSASWHSGTRPVCSRSSGLTLMEESPLVPPIIKARRPVCLASTSSANLHRSINCLFLKPNAGHRRPWLLPSRPPVPVPISPRHAPSTYASSFRTAPRTRPHPLPHTVPFLPPQRFSRISQVLTSRSSSTLLGLGMWILGGDTNYFVFVSLFTPLPHSSLLVPGRCVVYTRTCLL